MWWKSCEANLGQFRPPCKSGRHVCTADPAAEEVWRGRGLTFQVFFPLKPNAARLVGMPGSELAFLFCGRCRLQGGSASNPLRPVALLVRHPAFCHFLFIYSFLLSHDFSRMASVLKKKPPQFASVIFKHLSHVFFFFLQKWWKLNIWWLEFVVQNVLKGSMRHLHWHFHICWDHCVKSLTTIFYVFVVYPI